MITLNMNFSGAAPVCGPDGCDAEVPTAAPETAVAEVKSEVDAAKEAETAPTPPIS